MTDLQALTNQRPVIVIGAAFGDVMLGLDQLPRSGGDVIAEELGRHIGGCAFNVARALSRMDILPISAIPVGNGCWGEAVEAAMLNDNLLPLLRHPTHDNGWCIAMVEASKERTFITMDGCEQHWNKSLLAQIPTPDSAIVYVSGYELVSEQSAPLRQWLLDLSDDKTLFVDFGPRLRDIDPEFVSKLLAKKPILTVNRDELALLNQQTACNIYDAVIFTNKHQVSLICRFDSEGAKVCQPSCKPKLVPAFKVNVSDTIAAGDSHCAGVIAGLSAGWSLNDAVELGNMVAAIVVSRPGSDGAPTLAELNRFQAENRA
jgi:sugar/nucleoside kinase (ribokinase family)